MWLMMWPAQSQDLNPIEHLWQHLKMKLAGYKHLPTSIHQLWKRIEEEWDNIAPEYCQKLISSMPSRVKAVIKANGK